MTWRNHAAKMQRRTAVVLALLMASGIAASAAAAPASDPHAHHRNMAQQQSEPRQDRITLPDTALITQNGEQRRLDSDIVAGRIVVIDFVYTSCTTVCPVLSAILSQVQGRLDERIGSEVMLVSISVDPVRDTPARLKAYADKLRAGDGWVWLTGDKQAVDGVLEQLGAYSPNFEDHPSMVLVGDAESGDWARFLGFPSADQIVTKVDQLTAVRTMQATKREQ
jgi:protein SCO1/2